MDAPPDTEALIPWLEAFLRDLDGFSDRVRSLVRSDLGCECPESIFDHIRLLGGPAAPAGARRALIVGDRLLLVFGPGPPSRPSHEAIAHLIRAGFEYREAHGLNRLRVILSDSAPEALRTQVATEIDRYDDRVHVHYL